jgi:hypothetical protein
VADHPLRPATHRRLGRPLPHQLANRTQTAPLAHYCFLRRARGLVDHIRYYPPFRVAIPNKRARYLRVTHPSATGVLLPPFDLHVLGTPPALVLSQDQTLQKESSTNPRPRGLGLANIWYVSAGYPHVSYDSYALCTTSAIQFSKAISPRPRQRTSPSVEVQRH